MTIAREWWAGDGTQEAFTEVSHIEWYDQNRVPELLKALVDTVPPDESIAYVGTTVLEDLMAAPEPVDATRVAELVRAARLSADQVALILSGMYPEFRAPLERLL